MTGIKTKVAIGMSGGVDSSTAAALLKEKGYDVIGITILTHTDGSAAAAAQEASEQLEIPHHVFDFRAIFKEKVITNFSDCYFRGETPNPCVECNRTIKFGEFLAKARELGAEYIATGHYVRKIFDQTSQRWHLYTAVDSKKDQSYVLYSLNQEQLAASLFPLSEFTKEQVREFARERNLLSAEKEESQEICFIPENNYAEYINSSSERQSEPGDFVSLTGEVLGKHRGIIHYTVGQRKGLGVTFGKPMFVTALDPVQNRVILGEEKDLFKDILLASSTNWIAFEELRQPLKVQAKIRYKAKPAMATVYPEKEENRIRVEFAIPQRAITPGQSVVFYDGSLVLGGGIILTNNN